MSFTEQLLQNQKIMIQRQTEIARNMEIVNVRMMKIERDISLLQSRSHETKIYVKRGLAECKLYLKACQEGYRQTLHAAEKQLEETEELQNCLATATVSTWG